MARFFREIRPYPGRWIGICARYNRDFINFTKTSCPVKAWDVATNTWWFPESYEPILSLEMVKHNLITQEQATAFSKEFYAYQKLGTAEEPYAILGIKSGSPRGFVDLAYQYWKRQFQNVGGAGTQLAEIEGAYAAILAGNPSTERDPA